MANRYWVGGTGTWNTTSTTNWSASTGGASGASVPTAADSVFFDQAGTYTVTLGTSLTCLDFTVSSGAVVTFAGTSSSATISGSMSLVAGTFWSGTGTLTFNSTSARTITTNGVAISLNITLNGAGGTWTLGGALTIGSTNTFTLTTGTLDLAGYNLTTGIFSSSNSNTRSIAFGTGNIVLSNTIPATVVLSMASVNNFTYTGTGGFTANASVTRTFNFGTTAGNAGNTTNAPNLTFTGSGTAIPTIGTDGQFNKLDFGTTAFTLAATTVKLNALTLSSDVGAVYTNLTPTMFGTGAVTTNGKALGELIINSAGTTTLAGAVSCTTYTQTAGTVDFATFNLTCSSTATYTAGTLNNIGNISCTSWTVNTGSTFTLTQGTITPSTSFIVLSATSAFNYNGGTVTTNTFTQTAGTVTLGATFTLPATCTYTLTAGTLNLNGFNLTTGIFATAGAVARTVSFGTNNIIVNAASGTVLSMAVLGGFTYTGTGGFTADASVVRTYSVGQTSGGSSTNSPNLSFTGSGTAIPVLTTGSWFNTLNFGTTAFTLAVTTLNLNNFTLSSGGTYTNLSATIRDTGTITPNGKTIAAFTVNHAGTTTFAGALGCTTYTQTAGTIDFATFNLTCSSTATYTAGTLNNIGTITCTTWTCGGTFTLTQGTITPSTSFVVTGGFNYNGGTVTAVPTFTHTSGTVTLGATFTLASTCTYTLTAGTLNLNGFDLSTGLFTSSGSTTRSITFGTNNIVLTTTTAAANVLFMQTMTNFTYTGTGGFLADASVAKVFVTGTTGATSANAPNLTFTGSGTAVQTISNPSWFNKLDFGSTAFTIGGTAVNVNSLTLSSGGTFTGFAVSTVGTGTITPNGKTINSFTINNGAGTTTFAGALGCTTYTQTAGTIDFANFNLTCSSTASYTAGTLTNTGTITCTTWTCAGTFTMTNGTITPSTSFVVTGGFNYNGGTLSAVATFTHTSGTVTLGQAYALTATGTYSLTTGTLNLNGFNLTTGIFSSSGTLTRSVAFGSNNIILAHTSAAQVVLSMNVVANFTWSGTGGFVTDASITRSFNFGSPSAYAPNLTFTGTGSAAQTFVVGSYYNKVDFGSTTFSVTSLNANSLVLSSGGTYTSLTPVMSGTGFITSNGKTVAGLTISSGITGTTTFTDQPTFATATATLTLSSGNLDLSGFNLTVGEFISSGSSTRSVTFGTNDIVLAHTTANRTVLSLGTATNFSCSGSGGFVSDASITRTYNCGSTGGTAATAPNLTLTGSGTAVQTFTTDSWFNNLNFGTTAFAVPTTSINVSTLTLSSGGTFTALQPILTRTQTWTSQFSKQLGGLGVNGPGVTLTLDNTQTYITNSEFTLTQGTLDLGGYDLTIGRFTGNNSNTRGILFGSNNIILNWSNAGVTNLSMATATNFTYTGTGGFVSDASITRTFNFGATAGGTSTNSPNLTLTGSGTAVQTFTTGSTFNKLDFGTTSFAVAATALSVNSLTLSSGGTFSSLILTTFGTGTITTNGKTIYVLTINCPGGTTTLAGALTTSTASSNTLTAGTLDLAGYTMTAGSFISDNTNTRSILFGSGNIVLAFASAATTVLSMATATGFTWTGTGGFTADASITRTYTFGTTGGSATNSPNLTLTGSGTAVQTFTTGSWFDILNFGTTAFTVPATILNIDTLTLSSGGTFTGLRPTFTRTQTWTAQFSKQLGGIGVNRTGVTLTLDNTQTYTATSVLLLTEGTLDLGGYNLTIGTISSSNTNTRSIAFGSNNIILSTTTAAAVNISMADATNFSCTGTGGFTAAADITRTYTFGTTGGSATNSPNLTLTGSGTAVQTFTTGSWFSNLNFGTTAFTIAATNLNLKSLTLSSGGTYTNLLLTTIDTGTITSNGKTIGSFTINCPGGTTTLSGSLTTNTTSFTTLTAGILSLNGFDLTTAAFASTNTNTRAVSFGSNNIILNSSTAGTTVVNMATATGFTYTGTGGFVTDAATTRTLRFGDVAGGSIANSPKITLTGSGTSVITTQTGSWFSNLNFGTTAFTLPSTSLNLASLTLSSTGTYTGLTATMVDTGTITPNGKTIAAFTINHAGTTTLAGALGCTTYTQTAGTIDFATFNLACSSTATYTAGTLTNTGTITCTTWTCAGTFTMTNGTITPSISFVVTGGFNYNGGTLSAIGTFTHTSGTVTLGQSYALTGTGIYTLTAGTLNLTSYNLTTGQFSSNNANTRSISFGSGNIVLALTTAATTNLSMANATGCTVTGTGGFTAAADITRTFVFGTTGGSIDNAPNLTLTGSGTAIATITTGSWFNKLDFGTTAFTIAATTLNLESLTLSATGTYTNLTANMVGTGTITPNGKTIATLTVNCPSGTTTLAGALTIGATATTTLTAGTLDLSGFILTTGIFSSSNTNARSINFNSGNIALATSTAASTVLDMATATNFTVSGAGGFTSAMSVTRTFTFGTTGGSASNAPSLALTSGASIPTITTGSWFDVLDFTGSTCTPSTTTLNLDTLTLATGGTYTGLTPFFTRTQTWTSQFSKQLAGIGVNDASAILTLENTQTYITNSTLYVEAGTLSLGSSSVTFNNFISTGTGSRTITGPGTITIITNWTVNSGSAFTGSNYTIYMASQSAKTFAGTGGTYGTLVQGTTASLTITGSNAFEDIQTDNSSLAVTGQQEFTTPGTYSWTAPAGVTSVDVVAVGAGGSGYNAPTTNGGSGGGGGGLGWKNNITVVPGQGYTVVVGQSYAAATKGTVPDNDGGPSYFINTSTVAGLGGTRATAVYVNGVGGGYVGDGGGNGGAGGVKVVNATATGGGGAGGYSGNGGNGGAGSATSQGTRAEGNGFDGLGGAGGGGGCGAYGSGLASPEAAVGGGGGGVGIYGQVDSGLAGLGSYASTPQAGGGGGSGGTNGNSGVGASAGITATYIAAGAGIYGGGAGGSFYTTSGGGQNGPGALPGAGAVRIIWGTARSFPATNTQNAPTTGTFGIVFEAGTTQILNNFTASGTITSGTTLTSTVPGTQFTLLKTTGTVNSNYLTIQDSNVSAAFFANTNSTDAGNNTGWNFTAPAVVQSGFSTFF